MAQIGPACAGGRSPWIRLAALAYAGNAAFGTAVAGGAFPAGRFRRVHGALFALTLSTTVLALVRTVPAGRPGGLLLLPALAPLAALPYRGLPRRAGVAAHRRLALAAAPFYLLALAADSATDHTHS